MAHDAEWHAEREYEKELRMYHRKVEQAQRVYDKALRNPISNVMLGLPAELPESTIEILRHTQALAKVPYPNRARIYKKFGIGLLASNQGAR